MEERTVKRWRTILLLIAAACIVFGLVRHEADTVYTKAVNICLECIGIG